MGLAFVLLAGSLLAVVEAVAACCDLGGLVVGVVVRGMGAWDGHGALFGIYARYTQNDVLPAPYRPVT